MPMRTQEMAVLLAQLEGRVHQPPEGDKIGRP
jgi:hypothetical protein